MRAVRSARAFAAGLLGFLLAASPTASHAQFFNAVYSRDAIDVIAVADSGLLYRSVNGGAAWTRSALGNKPLRDVIALGWTIVAVGDSGKIWRSTNSGGTWSLSVASGIPSLKRIESLGGNELIAVGSAGTALRSTDAGATWSPLSTGTTELLNSVRFLDAQNGWIAGRNGFLARTSDGGQNWTPVALGTVNHLNCVDAKGSAVWVVGDDATAFRSTDGGSGWTQLDLHADARPDVKAVWLQAADTVYITGGGGFIRRSTNGGNTWTFQRHTLQGAPTDMYFVGASGWVTSNKVRAVMRTSDGGATWSMPAGAVITRDWVSKVSSSANMRGNTLAINPVYKTTFYAAMGNFVYVSRDEGETWSYVSTIPVTVNPKTNSFIVSPKDSNYWVAAVGVPDRVVWSDDAGVNWHEGIANSFGEYGVPLGVDPDHPDTMFFAAESGNPPVISYPLFRSTNRGQSWAAYSDTLFRSPCNIVVVPESDSAVILVGDGITSQGRGKYWRATGGSSKFTMQLEINVSGSEIPGMAVSRLRPNVAFGTNWGAGGVQRSTDNGLTWPTVHTAGSAWGVDIARDDPDCVIFGIYGGLSAYMSLLGGETGSFSAITGIAGFGVNYAFYARDRATVLALQGGGIWKMRVTQTLPLTSQSVAVTSPNGGESWAPGSVHSILWNPINVALARIEYRPSPAVPWQPVADVDGYLGHYEWTVPYDATASAKIRVSDAWDAAPADSSDLGFTIPLALVAETPASLGFGSHAIGTWSQKTVTVSNPGSAPLVVGSITTGTSAFRPGRTSFSLGAGASDTLSVVFEPSASVSYMDQLTLSSNGYNSPEWFVPLYGTGMEAVAIDLSSPDGGEEWRYGTGQKIQWSSAQVAAVDIEYQAGSLSPWVPVAENVPDAGKSYVWVIPAAASNDTRVRVREHGGGAVDVSKEAFRITVPSFVWSGTHQFHGAIEFGAALVNEVKTVGRRVANGGTAPLEITSITSDNPKFWPGRTSLLLEPGADDTLDFYYRPEAPGFDTAHVTLVTNDPHSPIVLPATGRGSTTVAAEDGGATAFALWQNRPNPFAGRTVIRYGLPQAAHVSLEVYDVSGHRVASLVDEDKGPGEHSVSFVASATRGTLPSGIYFCRLRAGTFTATRRMVVMQ